MDTVAAAMDDEEEYDEEEYDEDEDLYDEDVRSY